MRKNHFSRGFTMIEFAVVITISGILMVSAVRAYLVYVQSKYHLENEERIANLDTAVSSFGSSAKRRYPCPADPSLPLNDPNAGVEACVVTGAPAAPGGAFVPGIALNSCNAAGYPFPNSKAGSICRVAGSRTSLAPIIGGVLASKSDAIVIGGIPFKTIRVSADLSQQNIAQASETDALDPWGYQYSYAVTENNLISQNVSQGQWGTIDVTSEGTGTSASMTAGTMVEMLAPPQSANFVVVGHGDDHNGAYNAAGKVTYPCAVAHPPPNAAVPLTIAVDSYNCNYGNHYTAALRATRSGWYHFDDVIRYSSGYSQSLWDFRGPDLINLNQGNVGVGTKTATPKTQVELKSADLYVTHKAVNGAYPTVDAPIICDANGSTPATPHCFTATLLGGYDTDATNPENPAMTAGLAPSNNTCAQTSTSTINVVWGIKDGKVQCTDLIQPGNTVPVDVNHPPVVPISVPIGVWCPGADDAVPTLPQKYVFAITATGLKCCDYGGGNCVNKP